MPLEGEAMQQLVEIEFCHLAIVDGNVTFGEPLMVEAGLNYLGSSKVLGDMMKLFRASSSAMGELFEPYSIPFIAQLFLGQETVLELLDEGCRGEMNPSSPFNKKFKVGRSSFGVLARQCKDIDEAFRWFQDQEDSTYDGKVEPFILFCSLAGPDVGAALRDDWGLLIKGILQSPVYSFWQHKLSGDVEMKAFHTIVLEKFYHNNKESDESYVPTGKWETWQKLYKLLGGLISDAVQVKDRNGNLIGYTCKKSRKRRHIRMMLEFPAKTGVKKFVPGGLGLFDMSAKERAEDPVDWFVFFHGGNCSQLFDKEAITFLQSMKVKRGKGSST